MGNKQEAEFCDDLVDLLGRAIDLTGDRPGGRGVELRRHERVLYDVTVSFIGSEGFSPRFGFLEQDIVFGVFETVPAGLGRYFYRASSRTRVLQPIAIIEVKYGSVTTHQLMTYSAIASKLKSVYPRSKYYLALGYCNVAIATKVMRHGTHFDGIFMICPRRRSERQVPEYTKGRLAMDLGSRKYKSGYDALVEQLQRDLPYGKWVES